jgi:hypothetical protein
MEIMKNPLGHCGKIIAIACWISVFQPHTVAAIDADKHAEIEVLLKEMGTLANMDRLVDILVPTIIDNFRKVNPKIPEATWNELVLVAEDEMKKSAPELQEPLITIYDANFTTEEIKQLVAFYGSPVGHKIATQLPELMQQTVAVAQAWGERVGARVEDRIRAVAKQKGYNL